MRTRWRTLAKTMSPTELVKHLIFLEDHTCNKHNVSYLHHPNCYEAEYPITAPKERVAFLDIEASNLRADFGIVLAWCLLPQGGKMIGRVITAKELKTCKDEQVVKELIRHCLNHDRIIGHYSNRFDIPFVRSRALSLGLDFPAYKSLWQTDTWRIARDKLCLSSNRLANVANLLHIKEQKTPITTEHWLDALMGKQESLDYILHHCQRDVEILAKVYNKIEKFVNKGKSSI